MLAGSFTTAAAASQDAAYVYATAERLGMGPFEIYRRAYRAWFGHDADTRNLERQFVACLFHGDVPFWVRDYCRRVIGTVRPAPAGPAPMAVLVRPGDRAAALLVAGAMALWLLLPGADCRATLASSAAIDTAVSAVTGTVRAGC